VRARGGVVIDEEIDRLARESRRGRDVLEHAQRILVAAGASQLDRAHFLAEREPAQIVVLHERSSRLLVCVHRELDFADTNLRERDVEPPVAAERMCLDVLRRRQELTAELLGPGMVEIEGTPGLVEELLGVGHGRIPGRRAQGLDFRKLHATYSQKDHAVRPTGEREKRPSARGTLQEKRGGRPAAVCPHTARTCPRPDAMVLPRRRCRRPVKWRQHAARRPGSLRSQ